ncbi:hypothetical protein GCM10027169_16040 [Gordonia jinhuaensis]|uniref:SUKH superfamily protein n=1 Tax=Gordonia jinhuaensis TaxID=1517702 RepID=A0A916TJM0_9ACTN|nr:hypothetical protein [Gordonia jinhuaensis]GGB48716.1 hypothetical protein GCM10011489_39780 [Gordonia jinhuaensis]
MTDGLDELMTMFAPPAGRDRDVVWADTENRLGRLVPEDYKQLVAAFGLATFCDQIDLFQPHSNARIDLASVTAENIEFLTDDTSGDDRPTQTPDGQPFDSALVIQWSASASGGYWLWYPDPSAPLDPTKYSIVFTPADQGDWWFFEGPTTDFIYKYVTGIEPPEGQYGNVHDTLDGPPVCGVV